MLRIGKNLAWVMVALAAASAIWVLNVELTYQWNVQHGLPKPYRVYHPNSL